MAEIVPLSVLVGFGLIFGVILASYPGGPDAL